MLIAPTLEGPAWGAKIQGVEHGNKNCEEPLGPSCDYSADPDLLRMSVRRVEWSCRDVRLHERLRAERDGVTSHAQLAVAEVPSCSVVRATVRAPEGTESPQRTRHG